MFGKRFQSPPLQSSFTHWNRNPPREREGRDALNPFCNDNLRGCLDTTLDPRELIAVVQRAIYKSLL